ncbi:MAG: FAD-dependent oxidoreductase [Candidatus Moraniibacteriota bacterium]
MQGYTLTLKEICDVADGTRLFVFDKPEGYVFKAGQYVALAVPKVDGIETDMRGLTRSFSIASAPYESELYFAMRQGESSFKKTFWHLKPADTVTVTKAVGFFVLPPENDRRPIVFLAGGIGITPVRSILKQAEHDRSDRHFTLFYANRFAKDAAFANEMKNLSLMHFRFISVLSQSEDPCVSTHDERGYLCDTMFEKYLDDVSGCLYYIVGSPQFSDAMGRALTNLGVTKEQCRIDPFTGLRSQSEK